MRYWLILSQSIVARNFSFNLGVQLNLLFLPPHMVIPASAHNYDASSWD